MFNHAIIDCDVLVYRCGFSIEKYNKALDILEVEPVKHAFYNINSMMRKIFKAVGTESFTGYITSPGKDNFRFDIFPAYKANRADVRKPVYFNEIREFLTRRWNAVIISGQEADDSCSIHQCQLNSLGWDPEVKNSIVCSIDKDFNNIPGWHYNYVKDEIYYVTEVEAFRNFYLQILTGDASDGIPRIKKGWRQKETEKALQLAMDESEMYKIVLDEIKLLNLELRKTQDVLIGNEGNILRDRARLVWLRRHEEEMWEPPTNR